MGTIGVSSSRCANPARRICLIWISQASARSRTRRALWTKRDHGTAGGDRRGSWRVSGRFRRGVFSSHCPGITTYYLIDPWRHLEKWDKPRNEDDGTFDGYFEQAMTRTAPWESKRIVLRGRTTEVIDAIPDGSLDLAYVDGDHTLHGISIDLIRTWQKVRSGGLLGGDDFTLRTGSTRRVSSRRLSFRMRSTSLRRWGRRSLPSPIISSSSTR